MLFYSETNVSGIFLAIESGKLQVRVEVGLAA